MSHGNTFEEANRNDNYKDILLRQHRQETKYWKEQTALWKARFEHFSVLIDELYRRLSTDTNAARISLLTTAVVQSPPLQLKEAAAALTETIMRSSDFEDCVADAKIEEAGELESAPARALAGAIAVPVQTTQAVGPTDTTTKRSPDPRDCYASSTATDTDRLDPIMTTIVETSKTNTTMAKKNEEIQNDSDIMAVDSTNKPNNDDTAVVPPVSQSISSSTTKQKAYLPKAILEDSLTKIIESEIKKIADKKTIPMVSASPSDADEEETGNLEAAFASSKLVSSRSASSHKCTTTKQDSSRKKMKVRKPSCKQAKKRKKEVDTITNAIEALPQRRQSQRKKNLTLDAATTTDVSKQDTTAVPVVKETADPTFQHTKEFHKVAQKGAVKPRCQINNCKRQAHIGGICRSHCSMSSVKKMPTKKKGETYVQHLLASSLPIPSCKRKKGAATVTNAAASTLPQRLQTQHGQKRKWDGGVLVSEC